MKVLILATNGPWLLAGLLILSFLLIVLSEAVVMLLFKLNAFKKCLADSLMANIGTVLLSILLVLIFNKSGFEGISGLPEMTIFYFIASFFEAWIVKLLNANTSFGKIIAASFVMNLLTLGAAYLFLAMDIF